jgi:hypothetical protein
MMHKWPKGLFLVFEPPELSRAAVTDNDLAGLLIEKPVDKREYRQAQTVREWHQDDTGGHDQTPAKLVEILHQVELTAAACRTTLEYILPLFDRGQSFLALRAC